MFLKIFTLFVVCCLAFTSAVEEAKPKPCVGCPTDHDANDPEVLKKLTGVLATINCPHQVKKVITVQKQVVSGLKFIVKFENQDGEECMVSWVDQPWISKDPQYLEFNCP